MLVASGGSEGEFDLRGVLGVSVQFSLMSIASEAVRRVADADSPFYTRSGFDPPMPHSACAEAVRDDMGVSRTKGPLRTGTIRYVGATSDIHHALAAPRWRLARSGAAAIVAVLRRCQLGVNDAYRFETPLGLRGLTSRRTGVTYIL